MFKHNFEYSFKTLFRNKALIFWTFAFPIILGTLFYLAFSNIENSEKLDIIDIAIIDNEEFQNNKIVVETFKTLGNSDSSEQLFNIEYTNLQDAQELLNDSKITGYILMENNNTNVVIMQNGINETILKYVVEEIEQTNKIINDLSSDKIEEIQDNYQMDYQQIYEYVANLINVNDSYVKDISSKRLSYTMIEFYTLIAMTCLYGGILGMTLINQNMANMSSTGARIQISPIHKGKLILSSVLASYLIQLIGLFILFIYTIFILHVDYGSNLILIILLALAGSLAGLTLGIAIATLIKANENVKTGIVLSITMLGCFLSGMMGITMKYIIDKNIPIINKFNPASMITDGFYSLYYYDTLNRYLFNIISLLVFSFIMILLSYKGLRRQKYDSI